MWRSALCLGTLSSAQVCDKCSDEDEQAFLQIGTRGREKQNDPAIFLASVKDMAHRMMTEQSSSPLDVQSAIGAIGTIRAALEMVKPSIREEHTRAQAGIERQFEEVTACHGSTSHGASVTEGFAEELAIATSCMEEQSEADAAQQRECNEFNYHANSLTFPSTASSNLASAEAAYEVASSWKGWIDEHWTALESHRTECNGATTVAAAATVRCGPVIAEYEETFCLHKQSCTFLAACHAHEVDVYNAVIADSQEDMTSRQNQYVTIKQVECICDLLEDALSTNSTILDASLTVCDENVDVADLTLSFPDPPAGPECPAAQTGDPECPTEQIPESWEGGESVTPTAAVHPANPAGTLYRLDVTQINPRFGQDHLCINQLSFYDEQGNRLTTEPSRARAQSELGGSRHAVGNAFDMTFETIHRGDYYCSARGQQNGWMTYQFGSATAPIASYSIQCLRSDTYDQWAPDTWTMSRSYDDGQTWTVIDDQSGQDQLCLGDGTYQLDGR